MTQQDKVIAHLRRSLELTDAQWAALDAQAERFSAGALRGPTTGQPTWRRLIAMIADGEIALQKAK